MDFIVSEHFPSQPPSVPSVVLRRDHWDDFGFKTMWVARLWLSSGRVVELGPVKVLQQGMEGGRTPIPETFDALDGSFCSIGQALSYYETLAAADAHEPGIAIDYLTAMRDVATDAGIRGTFEAEEGFETSLLRDTAARLALDEAAAVIAGTVTPDTGAPLEIAFEVPGLDQPLVLSYNDDGDLPGRMYAVIGYNGVGKTRLLAHLGMVAAVDQKTQSDQAFRDQWGQFVAGPPEIAAVLSVSYSAFDTFPIPHSDARAAALGRTYAYCGLRIPGTNDDDSQRALKSIDDIENDFHQARQTAVNKLRENELTAIFGPLLREPSFEMAGGLPALDADSHKWDETLARLSTGHTIVLTILVHLCAHLERRSLVLFDEPETHLHPPLVSALLRSVQVALRSFDSFAIAATHSPVVAQELPSRHVLMLRRAGGASSIEEPELETFGEAVGLITNRIFHLDNSLSDFQGVLRELADRLPVEEIDALFERGLSSQARVVVLSQQATDDEQ